VEHIQTAELSNQSWGEEEFVTNNQYKGEELFIGSLKAMAEDVAKGSEFSSLIGLQTFQI
jgi:hypothetical protein